MGSKLPPKSPIFIPIFSCYCPASFVVGGQCCKSCYQTITNYVPLSPFCTSEFCVKHLMRLRCGQGFCSCLYVAFQVVPGRCTSGHCAARKLRWTVVTGSARAPRIA